MQEVVVVVTLPALRRTIERSLHAGGRSSFKKSPFRSLGALSRPSRTFNISLLGATALRLPVGRLREALLIVFAAGGALSLPACACCETITTSTATGGGA